MLLMARVLYKVLRISRFICKCVKSFSVSRYKMKQSKPVPAMPNIVSILFDVGLVLVL